MRSLVPALLVAGLAALGLAGCADDHASPDDLGVRAMPDSWTVEVPVDEAIALQAHETCTAGLVCDAGADEETAPYVELEHNQTATHVALVLGSTDELGPGEEAVLQVLCKANGPPCGVLAEARGAMPLALDQDIVSPAGAILTIFAYIGRALPDTTLPFQPNAQITGTLTVVQTRQPPQANVLVAEAVGFDGVTAPCAFQVETSCGYPYGTTLYVGPFDAITGLDLTLSWSAVLPQTAELTLTVRCNPPEFATTRCQGTEDFVVTGPSPLEVTDFTLDFPPGARVEAFVETPQMEPVFGFGYPIRQEYRLEGKVWHLEDPDATNAG
jgi:hypothetical protein